MSKTRILLHPLISNQRSRFVLYIYFISTLLACFVIIRDVRLTLSQAQIGSYYFSSIDTTWLLKTLMSPYVQITVAFFGVIIAAATTAMSVVGPAKRVEQWLKDWESGYTLKPLQFRAGDVYANLIRLINDLYLVKTNKKDS